MPLPKPAAGTPEDGLYQRCREFDVGYPEYSALPRGSSIGLVLEH